MTRHTITEEELNEWLTMPQWQVFASSFGKSSDKSFEVDGTAPDMVFRVVDHGESKFLGTDKAAAIAAYNEAP